MSFPIRTRVHLPVLVGLVLYACSPGESGIRSAHDATKYCIAAESSCGVSTQTFTVLLGNDKAPISVPVSIDNDGTVTSDRMLSYLGQTFPSKSVFVAQRKVCDKELTPGGERASLEKARAASLKARERKVAELEEQRKVCKLADSEFEKALVAYDDKNDVDVNDATFEMVKKVEVYNDWDEDVVGDTEFVAKADVVGLVKAIKGDAEAPRGDAADAGVGVHDLEAKVEAAIKAAKSRVQSGKLKYVRRTYQLTPAEVQRRSASCGASNLLIELAVVSLEEASTTAKLSETLAATLNAEFGWSDVVAAKLAGSIKDILNDSYQLKWGSERVLVSAGWAQ